MPKRGSMVLLVVTQAEFDAAMARIDSDERIDRLLDSAKHWTPCRKRNPRALVHKEKPINGKYS